MNATCVAAGVHIFHVVRSLAGHGVLWSCIPMPPDPMTQPAVDPDVIAAKRKRLSALRAATRRTRLAVGIVLVAEIAAVIVLTTGWPVAI